MICVGQLYGIDLVYVQPDGRLWHDEIYRLQKAILAFRRECEIQNIQLKGVVFE